jgi:hypothetical protein
MTETRQKPFLIITAKVLLQVAIVDRAANVVSAPDFYPAAGRADEGRPSTKTYGVASGLLDSGLHTEVIRLYSGTGGSCLARPAAEEEGAPFAGLFWAEAERGPFAFLSLRRLASEAALESGPKNIVDEFIRL